MDLRAKHAIVYANLGRLLNNVESIDKALIPLHELLSLGFHPVQVGFSGDEVNFSPCYFRPLRTEILDEEPLADKSLKSLYFTRPCNEDAKPGDILAVTREMYKHVHMFTTEWDDFCENYHAMNSGRVVISHLLRPCEGMLERPEGDLQLIQTSSPGGWQSTTEFRHWLYPHMMSCIIHDVNANDQVMAIGEVKAICRALRFLYRPKDDIHLRGSVYPLLILSFLGPQHGRIIQAHYEGKQIIVQYTPLMSFEVNWEEDEAAPAPLFTRYMLGWPDGLDWR